MAWTLRPQTRRRERCRRSNAISGSILATAIAFVSLLSPVSVHAGGAALAYGGFQVRTGSPALRTIEFTVTRDANNNQRGQGHFFNHTSGANIHLVIDCLYVDGNVAYFSGKLPPGAPDPYFFVKVIDNGEGANSAPDRASGLYGESEHVVCSICSLRHPDVCHRGRQHPSPLRACERRAAPTTASHVVGLPPPIADCKECLDDCLLLAGLAASRRRKK